MPPHLLEGALGREKKKITIILGRALFGREEMMEIAKRSVAQIFFFFPLIKA